MSEKKRKVGRPRKDEPRHTYSIRLEKKDELTLKYIQKKRPRKVAVLFRKYLKDEAENIRRDEMGNEVREWVMKSIKRNSKYTHKQMRDVGGEFLEICKVFQDKEALDRGYEKGFDLPKVAIIFGIDSPRKEISSVIWHLCRIIECLEQEEKDDFIKKIKATDFYLCEKE